MRHTATGILNPHDPRHGTYAGATAHYKAGHPMCAPCREAKRLYSRRHSKTIKLGRSRYTSPRLLTRHIAALAASGMTRADIARAAGCAPETIRRLERGQLSRVNVDTYQRIAQASRVESETFMPRLGAARRIQALAAIGYPLSWIAAELDVTPQALANIIHLYKPTSGRVLRRTWDAVDALYRAHHMRPGPSVRARNIAARNGWVSSLAWDDIDDPTETPAAAYKPRDVDPTRAEMSAARLEDLTHFADTGVSLTEALRRLDVTRDALWAWCDRHDVRDLFERLAARERLRDNQWTSDEVLPSIRSKGPRRQAA